MKKGLMILVAALVFVLAFSINNSASASVSARVPSGYGNVKSPEKYYGNGLYCNQFTCRANMKETWQSVGRISYHGWMNGLPKLGTGGGL